MGNLHTFVWVNIIKIINLVACWKGVIILLLVNGLCAEKYINIIIVSSIILSCLWENLFLLWKLPESYDAIICVYDVYYIIDFDWLCDCKLQNHIKNEIVLRIIKICIE